MNYNINLEKQLIERDEIVLKLRKENLVLKKMMNFKNKIILELKSKISKQDEPSVPGSLPSAFERKKKASSFCKICKVWGSSEKQLLEHEGGKSHKDVVEKLGKIQCKYGSSCTRKNCLFKHY